MAQRFQVDPAGLGVGYPVIGANSIQFSVADAVYIDSSGFLAVATAVSKIFGYSLENITMASSNQTVAKVCPKYVEASSAVLMVYPTVSSVGLAQTEVGAFVSLSTVTTGAQAISSTTGATGQFLIVGIDPKADGTTYEAVVKAAYKQDDSGWLVNL